MTCAILAVCPDIDWIYPPVHRMMTHSLVAMALAGAIAGTLRQRQGRGDALNVALVCGLAYGSHLLMDLVGGDTKVPAGIQLLWPLDDRWFITAWNVFRPTDVGGFFRPVTMLSNALAVLREFVLIAPLAYAAFVWRRRVTF